MKAWIARERSGSLCLFLQKPTKGNYCWGFDLRAILIEETDLPEGINPQWSDEEPIEVELKIERI